MSALSWAMVQTHPGRVHYTTKGHDMFTNALVKRSQRGMSTAEYAVGTLAAVSFAGVLFKIITDPRILEILFNLLKRIIELALQWI